MAYTSQEKEAKEQEARISTSQFCSLKQEGTVDNLVGRALDFLSHFAFLRGSCKCAASNPGISVGADVCRIYSTKSLLAWAVRKECLLPFYGLECWSCKGAGMPLDQETAGNRQVAWSELPPVA